MRKYSNEFHRCAFLRRRAEKQVRRRSKIKQRKKLQRRNEECFKRGSNKLKRLRHQRRHHYTNISAPRKLSFLNNTDGMIEFIGSLDQNWKLRRPVWVVLEDVEDIDY